MKRVMLALALVALVPALRAQTLCAQGRITMIEHERGGDSVIKLKTDVMPGASWIYTGDGAIRLWQKDSFLRWQDRVRLLQLAFTLGSNVKITSVDSNCMGPQDEFEVTLSSGEQRID